MILTIEKMVYEGLGLSHTDGMTAFVKGAVTGDKVRVHITKKTKNYIKANAVEIIEPSKYRIKPICPYNKPCGSCDFGFIDYDYQLQIKQEIINEIFKNFNTDIKDIVSTGDSTHYRMKTQYPVCETKNSKRVLIGYYKENTHDVVNIKYCPVQPPITDEIADFIRENWTLGCYIEKEHKGLLRHINTRHSTSGDILLTLVLNACKIPNEIYIFADALMKKFPKIKGVFVNFNPDKTNKITGDRTVLIKGENFIIQNLCDKKYKIGSDSFFQINPKCAELLFEGAKRLIEKRGRLLDLYGGVGTIGIFLSDMATKITLVEENKEAINLAKENYRLNNIKSYEVFTGKSEDIIKQFINKKIKFENIVIDPPRKGSDNKTLVCISKLTDSVVYISCNPMTLKRDAKTLIGFGFELKSIQGYDMFPNTHHIEILSYFKRTKK